MVWKCTLDKVVPRQVTFFDFLGFGVVGCTSGKHGDVLYQLALAEVGETDSDPYCEDLYLDGVKTVMPKGTFSHGSKLQEGDVLVLKLDMINHLLKSYVVRTKAMWQVELRHDVRMWFGYLSNSLKPNGSYASISAVEPELLPEEFWADA